VEQGKQIMYKMVEEAVVFVYNVRSQALARLGMDYETLPKKKSPVDLCPWKRLR
jgi:crotonobetainyl-CoA:carnitine CoA-transferase CaiB-like acyl-CoA transferase